MAVGGSPTVTMDLWRGGQAVSDLIALRERPPSVKGRAIKGKSPIGQGFSPSRGSPVRLSLGVERLHCTQGLGHMLGRIELGIGMQHIAFG